MYIPYILSTLTKSKNNLCIFFLFCFLLFVFFYLFFTPKTIASTTYSSDGNQLSRLWQKHQRWKLISWTKKAKKENNKWISNLWFTLCSWKLMYVVCIRGKWNSDFINNFSLKLKKNPNVIQYAFDNLPLKVVCDPSTSGFCITS